VTPSGRSLKADILGVWRLTSRVDVDAGGRRRVDPALGADPLGMLCFSPAHFAAQFMRRDRTAAEAPAPAGANNSRAVDGYDAYFGTYDLNEAAGTLLVRLEGAISPDNIGRTFERRIAVAGDELTITLATTAGDGTPLTRRLIFARLA
jgi:Lipocalin-like domain